MVPPFRITSRQNSQVKDAVRLRSGSERRRLGRFIVDGVREITRAIEAGIEPLQAFVCDELCKSAEARQAKAALASVGTEILDVSPEVFAKLAFGERQEGIVLVAEAPARTLSDMQLPPAPLVAVLEGIEKPGNVGAILRSADAAGIDAVIVADGRSDLFNPNSIRASLGTVFSQNVREATTAETIGWLRDQGLPIVAAQPDAKTVYADADFRTGVAIVLGSEAAGLTPVWTDAGATAVRIPMHGLADSLNVSTTAAVLFYEALRQRSSSTK